MTAAFQTRSPSPPALRVLVVADDDDSRELMAAVFRATGPHQVTVAENAERGLLCLRKETYDLVVTDLELVQGAGLKLVDQAITERLLARTFIAVCCSDTSRRRRVLERGAIFVPRPLSFEKLLDVVRRAQ